VLFDLVYKFDLLEGSLENPTKFQIIPDIKIPFTCLRLEIKGCLEARKCIPKTTFQMDSSDVVLTLLLATFLKLSVSR
jgi:hypothetical protein